MRKILWVKLEGIILKPARLMAHVLVNLLLSDLLKGDTVIDRVAQGLNRELDRGISEVDPLSVDGTDRHSKPVWVC